MLKKIIPFLLICIPVFTPALAEDVPRVCDITVEFGSYTSSIDTQTYEKIMSYITSKPSITEKHAMNVGAQGERTLCLNVATEEDIRPVYKEIRVLIPEEAKTGWEKITSKTGKSFQTKQTEKFTPYGWENTN